MKIQLASIILFAVTFLFFSYAKADTTATTPNGRQVILHDNGTWEYTRGRGRGFSGTTDQSYATCCSKLQKTENERTYLKSQIDLNKLRKKYPHLDQSYSRALVTADHNHLCFRNKWPTQQCQRYISDREADNRILRTIVKELQR